MSTIPYPPLPGRCPHAGACRAPECHAGRVPRSWALGVVERSGAWYARRWEGLDGVTHAAAAGEEPPLDRPPLWIERKQVLESLRGAGTELLQVVLEEAAHAGVVGLRAERRGREMLIVALCTRDQLVRFDGQLRARVGKEVRIFVRRGVRLGA